MTNKIFRSTLLVAAVVLLCSLSLIMGSLYDYFDHMQVRQLRDELRLAAVGTEQNGAEYLKSVGADDFRLTWVAPDGTVLYDTHADELGMENHAGREEIIEALEIGSGSAYRQSATLLEGTIYEARRLADGTVLRISVSQSTLLLLVLGMLHPVLVVAVIAIVLSAVLAHRMSKRIVEPLNRLDLEHPLASQPYEEIKPLLGRINQQNLQIRQQMRKLRQTADEFRQITANMNEGLVLLDKNGNIVSINDAAGRLLEAGPDCIGRDLLAIDRSREMQHGVDQAYLNGSSSFRAARGGREYRFVLDRTMSEGSVIGLVVLAIDVTEQAGAERTRREFSANVSHEMKTPLQAIMGSAELLENGLVQEADVPRFLGHIRTESARLLNLIEDIIRLSQLDGEPVLPREEVDLLPVAEEVRDALKLTAGRREVTLTVAGEPCTVNGVRSLLYEIVYNLCDNAVKYNVPGGTVAVRVAAERGKTVLTVADTGIGIPPEHQDRVFERFYRVDKSHSRASGGTGLGLSIVKHAVQHHNGSLSLDSVPGKGTTVTVIF